ncbi:MAG: hypothetical protein IAE94_01040 [Chthoniobacterales bacterium]|nr:hypothetical protein [Chthoniobacterales bacterium]
MAGKRRQKREPVKFHASFAGTVPETIPTRWVKFVVGLFLLPPAWVLTQTFFTAFARTTLHDVFWLTEEFWFFALGSLLWTVIFFGLPRPLWIYVFGHEFTHALWVLIMGGRVHKFHVSRKGGHILADKTNTWIALAPYFFPLYSLMVLTIYGTAALFTDVSSYRQILYGAVGFTWAFHLSFTLWMIPKGQPDLTYGGTFFSLILIYTLNLLILTILLIIAAPGVTAIGFLRDFFGNAAEFSHQVIRLTSKL